MSRGAVRVARVQLFALVGLAGLLAAACASQDPSALQDFPGTTRQQLITERANPAIVVVQNEYKATVSVPDVAANDGALQALANQIVQEALNGQIGTDDKSLRDAYTGAIAANPNGYMNPIGPGQSAAVTVDYQCTGSIVTPDGYIVTAAHCTNVPGDERQNSYVKNGLQPIINAEVQAFESAEASDGTFDAAEQKQLAGAVAAFLQSHAQVSGETNALATALYSFTDSGQHQISKNALSLVTQGNAPAKSTGPFGDKDVSIVKLDGHDDLPTLAVSSDGGLEGGQELYIDGYPGDFEGASLDKESPSTVTAGSISSRKTSDSGVPLLETTATVAPGSSGSPGMDDTGAMVGVVSYGSGQYNYLIGGSVVLEYLHEKNIQPRESTSTRLYDVALNDYHRSYFKRALPELQQVKGISPSHPYVDAFIQRTQVSIQQGKDQTPLIDGTALVLVIAAAAVVVVGGAVAVPAFLLLRRSRPSGGPGQLQAAAQGTGPGPAGPAYSTGGWTAPAAPPPGPGPPQAAPAGPAAAAPPAPVQPQPAPQVAPAPQPTVSPDGHWRWDGRRWVPNQPSSPPQAGPRDYPRPPGT